MSAFARSDSAAGGLSAYTLTEIFRLFDTDSSESIDLDEFKRLVRVLLKFRAHSTSEPEAAQVNSIMDTLRPRLSRFCAKCPGYLDLTEFLSAVRADATLEELEWISVALATFFSTQNHAVLNSEFPFEPTFEKAELKVWHSMPPSLECTLPLDGRRKVACIPSRNWQVAFRLSPEVYPPDGRAVQVKIHRADTVADVAARIVQEWPGLRGRDFHPPSPAALQLRINGGRVYLPSELVDSIGFLFRTPGFVVEPAGNNSHSDSAYSLSAAEVTAFNAAPPAGTIAATGAVPGRSSSSHPPLALLLCEEHLGDIRHSLHAEAERHRRAVEKLEWQLDAQSDALVAGSAQLGDRFQADQDDLKRQITGVRGDIAACRRGWAERD